MFSQTVAGRPSLKESLPFTAKAVVIDNLTSEYLYLPTTGRWIKPFTSGNVIRLNPSQQAEVTIPDFGPDGTAQALALTDQRYQAQWFDEDLVPRPPSPTTV
jgi:hypothetical protein